LVWPSAATGPTSSPTRSTPPRHRLASGAEIAADVIVTATGLRLQLLGPPVGDGGRYPQPDAVVQGAMYGGIPNLTSIFGYTNASWTLRRTDLAPCAACSTT
jgi:cation diffusion facilitator CzcD-associated flavoprotein CzcO